MLTFNTCLKQSLEIMFPTILPLRHNSLSDSLS